MPLSLEGKGGEEYLPSLGLQWGCRSSNWGLACPNVAGGGQDQGVQPPLQLHTHLQNPLSVSVAPLQCYTTFNKFCKIHILGKYHNLFRKVQGM